MKNKRIAKIVIVTIIMIAFVVTFGKTYSKYVLTRHFETTFSSLPFYFEATPSSKDSFKDSLELIIKNHKGDNYNSYNVEYEILLVDTNEGSENEQKIFNGTISGDSQKDETIPLQLDKMTESTNKIRIRTTKPYSKVIDLDLYTITYQDIPNSDQYPQKVFKGGTFRMELTEPFPIGAKPFYGSNAVDYRFENDTLIVENVTADLLIKSNYIQSIEDLVTLSNYVKGGNTYKGVTFTLDKDLNFQDEKSYRNANRTDFEDINGVSGTEKLLSELTNESGTGFPSIGNYIHHFQGSLEGDNHTIDNLYIHSHSNGGHPETAVASLFGFITDGEIKNLTVKGNTFTDETANIGGITSYASNISLDNVHNYINITSYGTGYSVGGLIGSVGNDNIGLLGDNIRISNCSNHGTLQGGNHGGGLVGAIADKSHLFVNNSYNAGNVKNSIITNAGILALNNGNCYMNNSYNIGHISSNGAGTSDGVVSLGGLMAANYGTAFVINSYNRGIIEYNGTKAKGGSIAGLIGLVQGGGHILNSYNIGTIKDSTNRSYVGGIANTVTWNNPVHKQIYNTYNAGAITGGSTRYQIGYQYSGSLKDVFYKSGTGISSSNSSGATEISDANMKLDANNSNSLAYKLNNGINNINLSDIRADLINHGYNSNYFELSLNSWIIDSETGYPTFKN